MALTQSNSNQTPDNSILDANNKQAYLGNQFVYSLNTTVATGSSETPIFLMQGLGTGKNTYKQGVPTGIFIAYKKAICITASQTALFNFYLNPAFSDTGAIVTPVNARVSSTTTSVATISKLPTVVTNGTLLELLSASPGNGDESKLMFILDEGQSLLVTATVSANSTNIGFTISWYEL